MLTYLHERWHLARRTIRDPWKAPVMQVAKIGLIRAADCSYASGSIVEAFDDQSEYKSLSALQVCSACNSLRGIGRLEEWDTAVVEG
jgi:hypothetical protein